MNQTPQIVRVGQKTNYIYQLRKAYTSHQQRSEKTESDLNTSLTSIDRWMRMNLSKTKTELTNLYNKHIV